MTKPIEFNLFKQALIVQFNSKFTRVLVYI